MTESLFLPMKNDPDNQSYHNQISHANFVKLHWQKSVEFAIHVYFNKMENKKV